jgi:hypothetical protein
VAVPAHALGVFPADHVYVQFALAGYKEPSKERVWPIAGSTRGFGSVPVGPDDLERARAALIATGLRADRISATFANDPRDGIQLGNILIAAQSASVSEVENVLRRSASADIHGFLTAARIVVARNSCDSERQVRRQAESNAATVAARFARTADLRIEYRLAVDVKRRLRERDENPLALCGGPFVPGLPSGSFLNYFKSPSEIYDLAEMLKYRVVFQGGGVFAASPLAVPPHATPIPRVLAWSIRDVRNKDLDAQRPRAPIIRIPPEISFVSARGSYGIRVRADGTLLTLRRPILSPRAKPGTTWNRGVPKTGEIAQFVRSTGVPPQNVSDDGTNVYVLTPREQRRTATELARLVKGFVSSYGAYYFNFSITPYVRRCDALEDGVEREAFANANQRAHAIAAAARVTLGPGLGLTDVGSYHDSLCLDGVVTLPRVLAEFRRSNHVAFEPPVYDYMQQEDAKFSAAVAGAWVIQQVVSPPALAPANWWTARTHGGTDFEPYDFGVIGEGSLDFTTSPSSASSACLEASLSVLRSSTTAALALLAGKRPRTLIDYDYQIEPDPCYLPASDAAPPPMPGASTFSQRVVAVP